MLSPSDFNDAVPQFTNGSYANDPLNPLFIEEPGTVDYNRGVEPLQTLPAQWWNWFANKFTTKLNKLNIYVKNIFDELAQLLSLVGITPDATESELTVGQLKGMFQTNYPQYLQDNFTVDVAEYNSKKFFNAGGAYKYFNGNLTAKKWLLSLYGERIARVWHITNVPSDAKSDFSCAYGNNLFAASCSGNTGGIVYSTDFGKNWQHVTSLKPASIDFIGFCNDKFITTATFASESGTTKHLMWSENLVDWEKCSFYGADPAITDPTTSTTLCAVYLNGIYISAGLGWNIENPNSSKTEGTLWWSEDGKVWHAGVIDGQASTTTQKTCRHIIYANNKYLASMTIRISTTSWGHYVYESTDGKNWTSHLVYTFEISSSGTSPNISDRGIVYGNGVYVISSQCNYTGTPSTVISTNYGGLWWSEDLVTWTQVVGTNTHSGPALLFVPDWNMFISTQVLEGAATGSKCSYSFDGKTWYNGINEGNGDFVASAGAMYINYANGIVLNSNSYSNDGIHWRPAKQNENGIGGGNGGSFFVNDMWIRYGARSATLQDVLIEGTETSIGPLP